MNIYCLKVLFFFNLIKLICHLQLYSLTNIQFFYSSENNSRCNMQHLFPNILVIPRWVSRGYGESLQQSFIGRMQDFRFYPTTLTNREIVELYSGVLPELHVQSECRCPPTHPRVHPLIERYCIPNAVEDTTNDRVLRLNLNAHPLSYINDQDMGTTWVSKIMTAQELDEGVTITVDLANGQYQTGLSQLFAAVQVGWMKSSYCLL
uniref:Laminin N-terminal domain-containing protein n=1 Tax=Pundamilia nyererei TaxID=303518 RepID=A0A3B4GLD9_9CICH